MLPYIPPGNLLVFSMHSLLLPLVLYATAVVSQAVTTTPPAAPVSTVTVTVTVNGPSTTDANGVSLPTRTATSPISCPQDSGAVYTASNGYIFVVECNADHIAGDMGLVYTNSMAACGEACASTAGCVDITYIRGACYLKKSVGFLVVYPGANGLKLISNSTTPSASTLSTSRSTSGLSATGQSTSSPSVTSIAATSTIVAATGAVQVPDLSASAPIASATASLDASGNLVGAQVILGAMGTGPGLCAIAGQSSFLDQTGQNYTLQCSTGLANVVDIATSIQPTWEGCIYACANIAACDAVVYSRSLSTCSFKALAQVTTGYISLVSNPLTDFAFLPGKVSVPFQSSGNAASSIASIFTTSAAQSTTVISASGTVAVPALTTAVGDIADATATVAAGTTLNVKIRIRWR